VHSAGQFSQSGPAPTTQCAGGEGRGASSRDAACWLLSDGYRAGTAREGATVNDRPGGTAQSPSIPALHWSYCPVSAVACTRNTLYLTDCMQHVECTKLNIVIECVNGGIYGVQKWGHLWIFKEFSVHIILLQLTSFCCCSYSPRQRLSSFTVSSFH